MAFEWSAGVLNYFEIVILICADLVLITRAESGGPLGGAADVELNRGRVLLGGPPAGLSRRRRRQKRNDILALMN